MRKKHFKSFFVIINLLDFSIRLSSNASKTAKAIGIHRNTLSNLKKRTSYKNFLIVPVTEE